MNEGRWPASTRRSSLGGRNGMSFTTYILLSKIAKKTYVGHARDFEKRLKEHNSGRTIFSKRYRPWVAIHKETFDTEEKAIKREKYLKSAAGRRWMKKNLFKQK